MLSDEQVDWICKLGRAAFVLLYLAGERRPQSAREISRRLRLDYETARKYLARLAELGAAEHTPEGWCSTARAVFPLCAEKPRGDDMPPAPGSPGCGISARGNSAPWQGG